MSRRPFPSTPERKRELVQAIIREGGQGLLDDVAAWRAIYPGAKLISIKVGNLDIGPPVVQSVADTPRTVKRWNK